MMTSSRLTQDEIEARIRAAFHPHTVRFSTEGYEFYIVCVQTNVGKHPFRVRQSDIDMEGSLAAHMQTWQEYITRADRRSAA